MRTFINLSLLVSIAAMSAYGCSSSSNTGFGGDDGDGGATGDGGSGGDGGAIGNGDSGNVNLGDSSSDSGNVTVTDTIYANTDTELYSLDPKSNKVTDIGAFTGTGGGTGDTAVTDLAVNAMNQVWVNTETVIYQAQLPASGTGPVALTKKATIAAASGQKFYALAFTPAGAIDANEVLIAGDNKGDLYAIDQSSGATTNLGGFGNNWQLSGDLVFYEEMGTFKGLATIRSCPSGKCVTNNDSLASVDMSALKTAYTSKTPGTLLGQTYGTGTGFGELFGVGAWQSNVYAFSRKGSGDGGALAQLITIDGTGKGTSVQSFPSISSGWSGAGVTTTATINVPPPPK